MDFEDAVTLEIPMTEIGEGDEEAFSDRLTMFAEYVDVERFVDVGFIAAED